MCDINKKRVREKYPESVAVYTSGLINGEAARHYRIWPMFNPFEIRFIGKGLTEEQAWQDAFEKLPKTAP